MIGVNVYEIKQAGIYFILFNCRFIFLKCTEQ